MKKFDKKNTIALAVALSLATLVAGCGSSEDPAPTPGAAAAPGAAATPAPAAQVNLPDACKNMYGTLITVNGQQLCQTYKNPFYSWSLGSGGYAPLTPGDLSQSMDTNIDVKKGDKLYFAGDARWGEANNSQIDLGWFGKLTVQFNLGDPCSANNAIGTMQGFVASDGTETFALQKNFSKQIQNDGRLRLGFNLPAPSASDKLVCARPWIQYLTVAHCEDASGATLPCP